MSRFLLALAGLTSVLACPEHDYNFRAGQLNKRAGDGQDWAYEASYNWGMINPNYTLCQTGTQQSPIQLLTTQGLSQNHIPKFNYDTPINGAVFNWGYGPAFSPNSTDVTANPSVTFDDMTLYLKGWHIHSPADHSVQGDRSKAELHLVHADASGAEKAVVAIRIDPGNNDSPFFAQFISPATDSPPSSNSSLPVKHKFKRASTPNTASAFPNFDSTERIDMQLDMGQALKEVNMFSDFWTYRGSLTSPPCTEGIRWFVAGQVMVVGHGQMREILGVSTYSARVEQEVWMHGINV